MQEGKMKLTRQQSEILQKSLCVFAVDDRLMSVIVSLYVAEDG